MEVLRFVLLFLVTVIQNESCDAVFKKWVRLSTTDIIYGTSLSVQEGQVSTSRCLLQCSDTKDCVSVNIHQENLLCELSSANPTDTNTPQYHRLGWTVFVRAGGRDCKEVLDSGDAKDGFKTIFPDGINPVYVQCEISIDGGGWTVIQKRYKDLDFYRGWQEYQEGFGNEDDYWLGLENIHRLTLKGQYTLRISMRRKSGEFAIANYKTFAVGSSSSGYRLSVGGYSYQTNFVNPGDSFTSHNGMQFTTFDMDQDTDVNFNCGIKSKGGWWYHTCYDSNLNVVIGSTQSGQGIHWKTWTGLKESLTYIRMMIRPK